MWEEGVMDIGVGVNEFGVGGYWLMGRFVILFEAILLILVR